MVILRVKDDKGNVRDIPAIKGDRGEKGADGSYVVSVVRTSGTGAEGTTDIYTMTMSDGTSFTFPVYNGADGGVSKAGDTMTGALQLQPTDSAGYAKVYKNANAGGDYGLQMQDVDPDGNFMGLTLSGKLQKLEFKKKKAGDADYTYTKLYDTDNPPTAEEVGALSEDGGTVYGNVNIQIDYGKLTIGSSDTHKASLIKNGNNTEDYGTILRDTNGEAVAEIKLSAANGNVKLAIGGKEYVLYHEGNVNFVTEGQIQGIAANYESRLTLLEEKLANMEG